MENLERREGYTRFNGEPADNTCPECGRTVCPDSNDNSWDGDCPVLECPNCGTNCL